MLSLGWSKGSRYHQLIALLGWSLPLEGNSASPVFKVLQCCLSSETPYGAAPKKVLGRHHTQISAQQPSNFWRIYKSKCSLACELLWAFLRDQGSNGANGLSATPTFVFQKTHFFYSKTPTRPTYDASSQGCSQWNQGQGMQKVCPMRMSSSSLHAGEQSHPRSDSALKVTRVWRPPSEKMRNYVSTSGTVVLARSFSYTWVWPSTWSRNRAPLRPTRKPVRLK